MSEGKPLTLELWLELEKKWRKEEAERAPVRTLLSGRALLEIDPGGDYEPDKRYWVTLGNIK